MNKRAILWLYDELPVLLEKGILDSDTAEGLKRYYGEVSKKNFSQVLITVFGSLGAVLVGLGIILLLAFNWHNFGRGLRTVVAFLPLVLAQGLVVFTYFKKPEASAWKEGSSLFLMASLLACIGLIGQTYHETGDIGNLIMTCMLLSLPSLYLLKSKAALVLYLIGITAWSGYVQAEGGYSIFFWILFLAIMPLFIKEYRLDRFSDNSAFFSWSIAFCLIVATGVTLEKVLPGLWIIIYSCFFAALYMAGILWFREADSLVRNPFLVVGSLGNIFLAFLFTYTWPWEEIGWHNIRYASRFNHGAAAVDYILAALLLVVMVFFLVQMIWKKRKANYLLALFPVPVIVSYLIVSFSYDGDWEDWGLLIIHVLLNIYILGVSIYTIVTGMKEKQMILITGGTSAIAVLIILRFVFVEYFLEDLVVRGLVFIFIGVAFFVVNHLISRTFKKQSAVEEGSGK